MVRGILVGMFLLYNAMLGWAFVIEVHAVAVLVAFAAGIGVTLMWDSWRRFSALR